MFWLYVYQHLDPKLLPPVLHYTSTHGGIHLLIVKEFFKSKITVKLEDFRWALLIAIMYLFCAILPLKYAGVIIYPHFFDKLLPTIAIIFGTLIIFTLSFLSGFYLSNNNQKVKG